MMISDDLVIRVAAAAATAAAGGRNGDRGGQGCRSGQKRQSLLMKMRMMSGGFVAPIARVDSLLKMMRQKMIRLSAVGFRG